MKLAQSTMIYRVQTDSMISQILESHFFTKKCSIFLILRLGLTSHPIFHLRSPKKKLSPAIFHNLNVWSNGSGQHPSQCATPIVELMKSICSISTLAIVVLMIWQLSTVTAHTTVEEDLAQRHAQYKPSQPRPTQDTNKQRCCPWCQLASNVPNPTVYMFRPPTPARTAHTQPY